VRENTTHLAREFYGGQDSIDLLRTSVAAAGHWQVLDVIAIDDTGCIIMAH